MEITTTEQGNISVVRVAGDLDGQTSPSAQEQLLALIADGKTRLLIDFSDLQFISSAGLRVLLVTAKELQQEDGMLRICSAGDSVMDVLQMSGFDSVIPVLGSQTEGLASFS